MRVAFVGKGGAGKSAIAGTFARALARRGDAVLAVDSDAMPGLAFSLGLESRDDPIPDEAVEEKAVGEEGPQYRLRRGLTAIDAVERYAATGPDGVRLLQFGKLRGHVSSVIRSQFAFRQILDELPDDRWSLVGDLPGGTRQAFFGWSDYAGTVLVVAEPSATSLLSARRLARLGDGKDAPKRLLAVANKVRERADVDRVRARTGLDVVASIPWDDSFADAERRGRAPIDDSPNGVAVQAVESLVTYLMSEA